MAKLREVAKYIRTKNAGPFWVTCEIFCEGEREYQQVADSQKICAKTISALFGVEEDTVEIYYIPTIYVVKISFPRPYPSGYRYERDMHFGQQYRLLAETEV